MQYTYQKTEYEDEKLETRGLGGDKQVHRFRIVNTPILLGLDFPLRCEDNNNNINTL